VSEVRVPAFERIRMSYDEWWALPEKPKSEWVDGTVVVVNVPPNLDHSDSGFGLHSTLRRAFPSLRVYADVPLRLPRNRVRRPDLMVFDHRPEREPVEETPILVVEVLSPGTHLIDAFEKAPEYAEAGIGQFWIVDPEARSLDVYALVDGRWESLLRLDDLRPTGEVTVEGHGTIALDLPVILAG
jgi:Uma2 family endonuclease